MFKEKYNRDRITARYRCPSDDAEDASCNGRLTYVPKRKGKRPADAARAFSIGPKTVGSGAPRNTACNDQSFSIPVTVRTGKTKAKLNIAAVSSCNCQKFVLTVKGGGKKLGRTLELSPRAAGEWPSKNGFGGIGKKAAVTIEANCLGSQRVQCRGDVTVNLQ